MSNRQITVEVDALRGLRTVPVVDWVLATLLSLLAALYVGLGEIDHVIGQFVNNGRSWSPTGLTSISTLLHPDRAVTEWGLFHDAPQQAFPVHAWLRGYAAVDVAFALTYGALAVRIARAGGRLRLTGALLVVAGATADVCENLLMFAGAGDDAGLVVAFTYAKWVGVLLGAAIVLFAERRKVRTTTGHVLHALYTHRYTVLVVLPLAVLGLAKGTDILEQLPDIQRQWLDHDSFWGRARDPVAAGAVLLAVGIAVLYVGRQRTDGLWMRTCERWTDDGHLCPKGTCPTIERQLAGRPRPSLHIWFFGPVLLAALAWLAHHQGGPIRTGPFVTFLAFPLGIGLLSLGLRGLAKLGWPKRLELDRPTRGAVSLTRYRVTGVVGDVLVGTVGVVAGLGSIRAFTGLVVLDPRDGRYGFMVVVGVVAVLVTWWLHTLFLAWVAGRARKLVARARLQTITAQAPWHPTFFDRLVLALTPGADGVWTDPEGTLLPEGGMGATFRHQRWSWVVLTGSLAVLIFTACTPVWTTSRLGVIGTFELALGSLSVVIATTVILLQRGGAPEVFWPLHVPYAPVTSLLVVAALFAGTRGGGVHDIRPYDDPSLPGIATTAAERPTLAQLFQTWLSDGASCTVQRDGAAYPVRPMLLYAAEGGGIRAAYWTTKALDRIATPNTDQEVPAICRSAFLSSGASGGSVGLTIAARSPRGHAADAVRAISGPEALAAASDGLVLRDTLYAATGVPARPFHASPDPAWSDRGTLIEEAWEHSIASLNGAGEDGYDLAAPFLSSLADWSWTSPGALVINSTSTTTSCRTLVSQIQVGSSPGVCSQGAADPADGAVTAANSTDLIGCTDQLRSTTAALLTARFPYVTPSGVVSCHGTDLQVVDGGYAENFGVGTLVDLGPALLEQVRTHNTCVLTGVTTGACATQAARDTLVAPMVVYLDNGTGSDLAVQPAGLDLEVLVPPLTLLSAKGELYSARSQLSRAENLFATDQLWDPTAPGADDAETAVDDLRASPVAIIFQATEPQVAGPLGWVLSSASTDSMDSALAELEKRPRNELAQGGTDPLFDHTIGDVLAMLPGEAPPPA